MKSVTNGVKEVPESISPHDKLKVISIYFAFKKVL